MDADFDLYLYRSSPEEMARRYEARVCQTSDLLRRDRLLQEVHAIRAKSCCASSFNGRQRNLA